ncbi:MAG: hypothetical protein AAF824_20960 [Bacteroidota bacterium]
MKEITRLFCGLTLLTVPTILYGGIFLLSIVSQDAEASEWTSFQQAMFRAGHAHAGVLILFSLVALFFSDAAHLPNVGLWVIRVGFPLSAVLISGGFFLSATGEGLTQPNEFIFLLYIGVGLLTLSLLTLGVGLIRKSPKPEG